MGRFQVSKKVTLPEEDNREVKIGRFQVSEKVTLPEGVDREVKIGRFQVNKNITVKQLMSNNQQTQNYSTIKDMDIVDGDISKESSAIKKLTNLFKQDKDMSENDLILKSTETMKKSRMINRFDVTE